MPVVMARWPAWVWSTLAAGLLLGAAWLWHGRTVAEARRSGAAAQAALDRAAFEAAAAQATARQTGLVKALAAAQVRISERTENALIEDHADLARRYDDLRLRWAAARRAGDAADSGAAAVSHPARSVADAACAASGWVDFETAAAAAHAADTAIAKDDAWIAWARAQQGAWVR